MKNIFIVLLVGLIGLTACEKETEIKLNPVAPMGGEWWVTAATSDGSYESDHFIIVTSNTAANTSDELLIDDRLNWYWFKAKVNLNLSSRTFSATDVDNLVPEEDYGYQITMSFSNGQLIEGGGISRDGNACDSIYMEVEYSDDPGTIYQISGVRRTGFLEDEW